MPHTDDILRVLPELIWCTFGVLAMFLQPFVRARHFFTGLALVGALTGTAAAFVAGATPGQGFYGLVQADVFSFFFRLLIGLVSVLVILSANSYLERGESSLPRVLRFAAVRHRRHGRAGFRSRITHCLHRPRSAAPSPATSWQASAVTPPSPAKPLSNISCSAPFATAFFLYGIALVYGATGTTNLGRMDDADGTSSLLKLGLSMILIGIGFKVAAAPFQIWTPDVYEGAPTPVTALFSAGPKAAAFALLLRIYATVPAATHFWFWAFWILAVLTMFAGNLGALVQTNLKRLLAYSSIAHAGYILVAFAAVTFMANDLNGGATPAYAAVLFYLVSYALVKIGAFTIVSQIGGAGEKNLTLEDYAGLAQRQPFAAAALSLFLLSLLGLPVTAGFFGKFYIFKAAVNSHLIWLAVIMGINSVIGAYYYLRLIVVMYMRDGSAELMAAPPVRFPVAVNVVLAITAIGTVYFGLFPNQVLNFILQPNLIAR